MEYSLACSTWYKVRVINTDKTVQYHVVNIRTNVTHSIWKSLESAMKAMRDVNRMARKVA